MPPASSLSPFFSPHGIALIGASQDPTKLGYGLARNLVQSNYQGVVHFVNPKGGSLLGRPMYTQVAQVPDPVDLAIILIPSRFVPGALEECGQRGIKAVIIGSGGFREIGPEGATLEEACLQIAQAHQMRLLGPNCIGLLDTHLPMDATFLPPPGPPPGDVAFISHSGAICAAVIDWARGQGFGLSRLVSLGNQADVNETDVLAPVAADPFTRVLTLYLEGVRDGRRFVSEARQVTQQKAIIALKVGRFSSGQRAVASHTGALAGQENAFNAAFRRAGVVRADTSEEMFDWARALAWCPPPRGRRVAVLTNAGGPGVTAADSLEFNGMRMAEFEPQTYDSLKEVLPPAASLQNPVDMLASASPDQYARSLQILLQDPGVDSVLVILPPPPMFTAGAVAKALIPIIHSADKPVVISLMGERLIQEAIEHFRAAHVAEYRFPERAASALAVLAQRAEYLSRAQETPKTFTDVDRLKVERLLKDVAAQTPSRPDKLAQTNGFIPQQTALELLSAYGIPAPQGKLVTSQAQAKEIAGQIGYPVAMKIASQAIVHKSDLGGVLLNMSNEQAVAQGFDEIMESSHSLYPEAAIDGVYVQQMISAGQEVIVGAVQDPQFGPLIMFGSGGVEVEGLKDVAFALAPVTMEEAENLLESTWAGRKLQGFRNLPPADREAVIDVLVRLAQLASEFPQLIEMEINPLRVLPRGKGVYAVDVRVRLAPA
ncbi:MAG: acetate--CoA ligase family protein [Anaerolineales bacterium]